MPISENTCDVIQISMKLKKEMIEKGNMDYLTPNSIASYDKPPVKSVDVKEILTSTTATAQGVCEGVYVGPVISPLDSMKETNGENKWLATSGGTKYDQDKPRMDLLDPLAIEGLAKVLTFGSRKYAAHNWRGGIAYSRLMGAAMRHLLAIQRGEDIDPESGLPHVDHLGCCWMFLSNMMKTRPDLDDRWKPDGNG